MDNLDSHKTTGGPKISVITASKNGAFFLKQTIGSILDQSFTNFEQVVADAVSTDETIEILRQYNHIRWKSEPDRHCDEGFYKALQMAQGEYIMFCCISDGYLDRDWFGKCADILDNDPEVSLVYGLARPVSEAGIAGNAKCSHFLNDPPPQKMDFFPYWLGTLSIFPESTFCVRANVFRQCFPRFAETDHFLQNHALLAFNYNFMKKGYLPFFLPSVASYCISSQNSSTNKWVKLNKQMKRQFQSAVNEYGNDILSGRKSHVFRDGNATEIRKIDPGELPLLRRKAFYYRMNRKKILGKRESNVISHQFRKLKILSDRLIYRRLKCH